MLLCEITIAGNLGRDAERKSTPDGKEYVKFNVAVPDKVNGEPATYWFGVTVWGGNGFSDLVLRDAAAFKKGDHVLVKGRFAERHYQSREGEAKTELTINAQNVGLLQRVARQDEAPPPSRSFNTPRAPARSPGLDDIPF